MLGGSSQPARYNNQDQSSKGHKDCQIWSIPDLELRGRRCPPWKEAEVHIQPVQSRWKQTFRWICGSRVEPDLPRASKFSSSKLFNNCIARAAVRCCDWVHGHTKAPQWRHVLDCNKTKRFSDKLYIKKRINRNYFSVSCWQYGLKCSIKVFNQGPCFDNV